MLTWMVYVILVTLLLSAAALSAEHALRLRRSRRSVTRWIWMFTIIASLVIPAAISSISVQVPEIQPGAHPQKWMPLRAATSLKLAPLIQAVGDAGRMRTIGSLDVPLKRIWWIASAALGLMLIAIGTHLLMRKRQWPVREVGGTQVYISEDVGPAVIGLIRPRIVIPAWIERSPIETQQWVLTHEQSHLDAGDQTLLTIALVLLILMPWNAPLWWQLRRLRYAIEIDCDARVLKGNHRAEAYAETLLQVGQRQSAFIGAVAAMSESVSFLEQRIEIMMRKPFKGWQISAVALTCLSVAFVAVAAQISPPNVETANGQRHEVKLPPEILDRYVGTYQLSGSALLIVTRSGQQLSAQLTGQPAVEIYPESDAEFFYKVVDAQISFVPDAQSQIGSLVLHQNGHNISMRRIDAATAEQLTAAMKVKIDSQVATPGSEAALRRLMAGISAGSPNYAEMSPELAQATRAQLPKLQLMSQLGAVQSIVFRGVGNQGWDVYEVHHEHGTTTWRINLAPDGIIAGALVMASP